MRKIVFIFIILLLAGCKNPTKNAQTKKAVIIDTIATGEPREIKYDTIVKISEPFQLNGIFCYWENHIVCGEEHIEKTIVNLKNYKTKQIVLETTLDIGDSVDYKSDEYFNSLNNEYFKDLNFDGFKDFYYYSKGSMAMTSLTNIYLFNSKEKLFEYSEYLSAIRIEEVDKKKRILITSSFDRDFEVNTTHHFDKSGKVKYTEVLTTHYDLFEYKTYEKIVNGKVVEKKVDSTATE